MEVGVLSGSLTSSIIFSVAIDLVTAGKLHGLLQCSYVDSLLIWQGTLYIPASRISPKIYPIIHCVPSTSISWPYTLPYLGPGDVLFISSHRIRIRPGSVEPETVSFTHRRDGISQEIDETYTLTINIESGSFGIDELVSVLTVTIRDSDGKFMEKENTNLINIKSCSVFIPG